MTIAVIKRAASVVIKLGENTAEAARQAILGVISVGENMVRVVNLDAVLDTEGGAV